MSLGEKVVKYFDLDEDGIEIVNNIGEFFNLNFFLFRKSFGFSCKV
jgi:hypothetical protein